MKFEHILNPDSLSPEEEALIERVQAEVNTENEKDESGTDEETPTEHLNPAENPHPLKSAKAIKELNNPHNFTQLES